MAVEVYEANREHMHVISFSLEPQGPVRAVTKPFLGLADVNDVAVDLEADRLFAEQLPLSIALPLRLPVSIAVPLRLRRLEEKEKRNTQTSRSGAW